MRPCAAACPPRNEAWKYTSLRQLERRSFAAAPLQAGVDAALLADIPAPRLVFVNGRWRRAERPVGLDAGVQVRRCRPCAATSRWPPVSSAAASSAPRRSSPAQCRAGRRRRAGAVPKASQRDAACISAPSARRRPATSPGTTAT
jgi:hypothetical protein